MIICYAIVVHSEFRQDPCVHHRNHGDLLRWSSHLSHRHILLQSGKYIALAWMSSALTTLVAGVVAESSTRRTSFLHVSRVVAMCDDAIIVDISITWPRHARLALEALVWSLVA